MQDTSPGYKNNFNLLRLTGAILVVISHTFTVVGQTSFEPLQYLTKGHLQLSGIGLTIFFFISGYFITSSAASGKNTGSFLLKRIYRIYPALIILVIISVFITGPLLSTLPWQEYFTSKDTWKYLFTATGVRIRMNLPGVFDSSSFNVHAFNASLWTITLEIGLYVSITIALLSGLIKNKKLFSFFCLLIIIYCFATVSLIQEIPQNEKRHLNLIGIFYTGSLVYASALSKRIIKTILLIALFLFSVLTVCKLSGFDPFFLLLIAICMAIYCFGFSQKVRLPLQTDISYGFYIWAFPVQQTIFMVLGSQNPYLHLTLSIFFILPFAFASWHFVEKKFIRLGHKKIPGEK